MYCIIAVIYIVLTVLLIALSDLEGYQLGIFLVPFCEAMIAASLMKYPGIEMKCKIKVFRKCILEVFRWTLLIVLLYRIINVYTIIIFTSEVWIWWIIELLQPTIIERITYV